MFVCFTIKIVTKTIREFIFGQRDKFHWSQAHTDALKIFLTNKNINLYSSPSQTPYLDSLREAAVKSFKFHYYRLMSEKLFTFEELNYVHYRN
jgi:hypothetical protein